MREIGKEKSIEGGIEWFVVPREDGHAAEVEPQCARCGSSVYRVECWDCGGELFTYHDCGEDCCVCLHAEPNVPCETCRGEGGFWHCLSSPGWCEANPLKGREHIKSTAMRAEAWNDV